MKSRLLISVSAIALLAGTGFAAAQEKGGPGAAPQSTSPQNVAPAQSSSPPAAQPGGATKGGAEQPGQRTQDPADRAEPKDKGDQKLRAQDRNQDKSAPKAATDTKSDKKDAKSDKKDAKSDKKDAKSDKKDDATTGQGAAGASGAPTSEQRTKISTTIRQSNVKKTTNVNFNISVGTVVPRTVTLHALPVAVVEVYPQWRGYRFILVEDEIIIVEPGSLRIIAVIDA